MHFIPRLLFVVLALAAVPDIAAQDGTINIKTPEGYLHASRKIHCSVEDSAPVVFYWEGRAHSRVLGEKDRLLFQVEGMNIRRCAAVRDPERGVGYRMVSREIMLYKDPESGEVLHSWQNPWTGKKVEVIHVANDPVNQPPTYGRDKNGNVPSIDINTQNNRFFISLEIPLFYTNPLGGDYQEYVGGTYHATEIFNLFGNLGDLLDASKNVTTYVSWRRLAGWLPWMEMGSRPGMMYFNTVGSKLKSWDDLSQTMKREIRTNYPAWREPPPMDDKRPNETSWTHFKKVLDARRAKEKREAK